MSWSVLNLRPRRGGRSGRWARRPVVEGLEERALLTSTLFGFGRLGLQAAAIHLQAGQTPTTLTLSGPTVPVQVGQTFTYMATIGIGTTSTTPPTGTVTFSVDGVSQPPAQVNTQGIAIIVLPSQSAGNHVVAAMYSGDFLYAPSQNSTNQSIAKAVTAIRFTVSPTMPTTADNVFMTVTLTTPQANSGIPQYTGNVTFFDNGSPLATVQVNPGGIAQLVRRLPQGGNFLTASYSGDTNFLGSSWPGTTIIVQPAPPGAVLEVAPTVLAVQRFGFHWQPTTLVVTYSTAMDPFTVQNPNNYRIVGPGGFLIPVAQAVYNPATDSVTLFPTQRLDLHLPYHFTIIASIFGGVTDAHGVPLDGAGNGTPGTDFHTTLTARNLVIPGFTPFQTFWFLRHYHLA
jgi:hypothetical protein